MTRVEMVLAAVLDKGFLFEEMCHSRLQGLLLIDYSYYDVLFACSVAERINKRVTG